MCLLSYLISSPSVQDKTVPFDGKQNADSGVNASTFSGLQQEPSTEVPPSGQHQQLLLKSKPNESEKSKDTGKGNRKPNKEVKPRPKSARRIHSKTSSDGGYLDVTTDVNVKGNVEPLKQHLAEFRQHGEEQPAGYQVSEEVSESFRPNLSGTALMVCGIWTLVM